MLTAITTCLLGFSFADIPGTAAHKNGGGT